MAGIPAVQPAAASHIPPGSRACIALDVQSYDEACPNWGEGPVFEAGTTGRVWEYCTDDDAGEMAYFEPEPSYDQPPAWVPDGYLEAC